MDPYCRIIIHLVKRYYGASSREELPFIKVKFFSRRGKINSPHVEVVYLYEKLIIAVDFTVTP
jgi:hypothetical protein